MILFILFNNVFAQDGSKLSAPEVGIYERLGETIPEGIILTNETGQQVDVKSLITKPTVISLVYFRCPGYLFAFAERSINCN